MDQYWNKFYDKAIEWIIAFGPRVILSIILLILGLWVIRVINRSLRKAMERKNFDASLRPFLQNAFHLLLVILLVFALLQVLGIHLTIFAAIFASLTVAAGLALSGTLQNFASGVLILMQRPFRIGDNILTQSTEGQVRSIHLFYTVVLTYDNKTIFIPNGQLSNNVITNLSREGKRRMDIEIKLHYGIDIEQVKSLLQKSIDNVESILKEPAPRIGMWALEADRYVVAVNVWTAAHGFNDIKIQLQEQMVSDLKNGGVKLPGM